MAHFFRDFLSVEVTARLGYPVHFHHTSIQGLDLHRAIQRGEADFVINEAMQSSCYESLYDSTPMAVLSVAGVSSIAGVMVVRADNTAMQSIFDIQDKIIVAGEFWGLSSYQLQANILHGHGIHPVQDASQVLFMDSLSEAPLEVLLRGAADVAFTDDFLFYFHPRFTEMRLLHIYPGSITAEHPFPASTEVLGQVIFSALPSVSDEVMEATRQALMAFDGTAFPAVGFVDQFKPARSSGRVRSTTHEQRLLTFSREAMPDLLLDTSSSSSSSLEEVVEEEYVLPARAGWRCYDQQADLYDWIVCPAGMLKLPPYRMQEACAAKNLSCHPEAEGCFCKPCISAKDLSVSSVSAMPALDAHVRTCNKGDLCGETEQRAPVAFQVVDNLLRDHAVVSFRVRDAEQAVTQGEARPLGNHTFRFAWTVQRAGSVAMELFVDGTEADNSPVWVKVIPRTCRGEHEIANEEGDCVCARSTFRVRDRCVELTLVVIPLVAAALLAVLLCVVRHYRGQILLSSRRLWLLDPARLSIAEPPEVLGWGSYCEVVKASYQSTEVAVKRVIRQQRDGVKLRSQAASSVTDARLEQAKRLSMRGGRRSTYRQLSVRSHEDGTNGTASTSPVQDANPQHNGGGGVQRLNSSSSVGAEVQVSIDVGHAVLSSPGASPLWAPRSGGSDDGLVERRLSGGTAHSSGRRLRDLAGGIISGISTPLRSSVGAKRGSDGVVTSDGRRRSAVGVEEEIQLLASLRHPNITTLVGAVKDNGVYSLVMEFMLYGSLFDLYSNGMFELEGPILHPILLDVASGMVFLHSADPPIVHGDLKSSNVLVDEKLRAKIADIGFASSKPKRSEGSLPWMAPEVLRGGVSSPPGDAYAFGVLLSEVLTRRLPYEGEDLRGVLAEVADPAVNRRPELPHNCPMMVQMIMQTCWDSDPAMRLGFDSIRGILAAVRIEQYPSNPKATQTGGDAMVYDMFPRHVADALIMGESVPEDRRECSTVFFSDVCGFTNISANLETHQVASMLDRLFSAMDAAAARHGIYKVETIGDCYIGVSNLVESQPDDHASRMAAFSLDAMEAARQTMVDDTDDTKGAVQIRAGFDCGPIVGSVVGTTYKKYTIFGNTVNTASRMESTGVPGRIQCSKRAAELLEKERRGIGERFKVEERGAVQVKGRGEMTTFFVNAL